jgi:hypothetical protein
MALKEIKRKKENYEKLKAIPQRAIQQVIQKRRGR